MVLCEQFIFTSSKLDDGGYQVTAQSSGITPEILKELEEYLYPIGVDPSDFVESKSMLVLSDKIVFIQSKNIGIGLDGRPDTMYSHAILMSKNDFRRFENDSRVFNDYYLETKKSGHLTPLGIENAKFKPDFTCVDIMGILQFQECLKLIFRNKKIAIINEKNQQLIQSILSLVPPSFRLMSFSTLVPQPEIQTKYNIIQTLEHKKMSLSKYMIIDISQSEQTQIKEKTAFDTCLEYLFEIIDKKNTNELERIYYEFESMPLAKIEDKIFLILGSSLLESNKAYLFKKEILENNLQIIKNIPSEISKKYWKQIKDLLSPEEHQDYALKFEIEQIINEHSSENITLNVLLSMFFALKNNDSKSRQALLAEVSNTFAEKLQKNGVQLLIDANYSVYRSEILDLFIKQKHLNRIILQIFDDNSLSKIQKQSMYDEFVSKASKSNPRLTLELLSNPMFDFTDEYESRNFKYSLTEAYDNILHRTVGEESQILFMVEKIFNKIMESLQNTAPKSSNTQNLKELTQILKVLQRFLNNVIENTQDVILIKTVESLQVQLKEFVDNHPIVDTTPKRWLFWDIFGLYD